MFLVIKIVLPVCIKVIMYLYLLKLQMKITPVKTGNFFQLKIKNMRESYEMLELILKNHM